MIHPDFTLLLWVIIAYRAFKSVDSIAKGAFGIKKSDRYGAVDITGGILWLLVLAVVVFA